MYGLAPSTYWWKCQINLDQAALKLCTELGDQRREAHFGMELKERPYIHILFNLKAS